MTTGEVETGDTTASGNSDVYAVFHVETDPAYAEQTVEISSAQLEVRRGDPWSWTSLGTTPISGTGVNTGQRQTAVLDDDGSAIFVFLGASFNINAPAPTI